MQKNQIQFSVLMSVYDKESPIFFVESIESILRQTLMPNEIVLVKDGELNKSLDNIINNYELKHPDIFTIVSLSKNLGLANALNEGMKVVRNPVVARMDSDDICINNRFELQVNYLIDNNLDIVGGQAIEFSKDIDNIISVRKVPVHHDDIIKFMKFRSPFSHPTIVFQKHSFEVLAGYDTSIFPEDYDFFVRAYLAGFKLGNVKDKVLYFRLGENLSEAIKRRWGLNYAKNELRLYRKFLRLGFYNYLDFIKVLILKIPIRILPFRLYSYVYFKFFR